MRDRHVELVGIGVFDDEEFPAAADVELGQALVAADAMVRVHDWRADGELRQVAQDGFRIARGDLATARLLRAFAEQLALGQNGQRRIGERKAVVERGDGGLQLRRDL